MGKRMGIAPLSPLRERLQNRGLSPIRAKPQILLVRGSVSLAEASPSPPSCETSRFGHDRANSSHSLGAASRAPRILRCPTASGLEGRGHNGIRARPQRDPVSGSFEALALRGHLRMRDIRQAADSAPTSGKRGMNSKNPPTKSTKQSFFIPHHFSRLTLIPVPPSDTPDDAMSGEAGPAPGWRAVAGTNPRPAATVSLRTKGLTRVMGSDASKPGYPDRKDVPQRHTDKAPALSRTSRQRGE
jgi:hypothetical protein